VEDVQVHLSQERDGDVHRIRTTVKLVGALDVAQRARLIEIANRCPVHRTLSGTIDIVDALELA
jgi:putative redox protein